MALPCSLKTCSAKAILLCSLSLSEAALLLPLSPHKTLKWGVEFPTSLYLVCRLVVYHWVFCYKGLAMSVAMFAEKGWTSYFGTPRVQHCPGLPLKGGQSKKYWHFKVIQSTHCWYSKLVSRDAWFIKKGLSSIGSMWAEKKHKNHWKFAVLTIINILAHFGRFLRAGWSNWDKTFSIKSGVSRHKFRVPTLTF